MPDERRSAELLQAEQLVKLGRGVSQDIHRLCRFHTHPLPIGLGSATKIETLEIFWPTSGTHQVFKDVEVDQAIEVHEGEERFVKVRLRKFEFTH